MSLDPLNPMPAALIDRRAERTHLFLVATLTFGRASAAVRVRNLSASGALVEGADVPPPGTEIVLQRGVLEAVGTVAWASAGKAGLAFTDPVAVSRWLPTQVGKRPSESDRPAFVTKPAAPPVMTPVAPAADPLAGVLVELATIRAQLDQLGYQLGCDAALVAAHPEVRLLAVTAQRISGIAEALRAR